MRRIFKRHRSGPPISFAKRAVDINLIILTSPIWFPLFLACGIWIKLVSKGNCFFLQKRVGYKKEVFTIVKFRTMRENAETTIHDQYARTLAETAAPMHKLDSRDPRLIFGGGFLRASGLDELPQFLNVLRGDMSLVGPRPCLLVELAGYRNSHRKRFDGLPGITGNWQVNGKNSTNFRRMIALDISYINNISVKTDLEILAKTVPALCRQLMELLKRPSVPEYDGSEQLTDAARQAHRIPIEIP
ncbi:MAG: sugar transferase [Chitinophagaceae bacterium]|nr:MAG: sugar transferase [Chitinophagaceae bacterium]